jgi:two-component system, sensor histidine kinase LadS
MNRHLFLLLLLLPGKLAAQQQVELGAADRVEVKGNLFHYVDESGSQSFFSITQQPFEALPANESPSFGFDRRIHWFRMDVVNNSPNEEFLLEIAYSVLDSVDFFMYQDPVWTSKTAGDMLPMSTRDVTHRHPIFSFHLPKYSKQSIYLKVHTISSVQIPIVVWHREAFFRDSFHIQMINGLFYGAMIIMMFYQYFLFMSTKDRLAFYYFLTLIAMVNIVALFQGYSFLYLFPEAPALNDWFAMLSGPMFLACSTLLTRNFLNLRTFSYWLDRLLIINTAANILLAIAMMIFFRQISYSYHHYFILLHTALVLVCASYCLYRKYRPARYYLIAWATVLFATVIFTTSNLGFLPGYLGSNYTGLMVGCVLQMLFISFAIGDKINLLEEEYYRLKEQEKQMLETEVKERTQEIQQKNERLEEVNRVKDKLFSVVSHDIKGPLGSLQMALSLLKSGKVSQEEFKKISAALEVRFSETTEFVENLLQWATLQLKGKSFEPSLVNLSDLAKETVRLLKPELDKKNIQLETHLQDLLKVYTDLNMMRSVLRNLLTNAIKFTRTGGTIALKAEYRTENEILVSVADTGVGISKEHSDKLFTLATVSKEGTDAEKGTGLGLMLCKEFIEKNGGKIWFESQEGKGTTFYFTLPMVKEVA